MFVLYRNVCNFVLIKINKSMVHFSEKQIDLLRGNHTKIANKVGCTREYVAKVLAGIVGNKRNGIKAEAVKKKAKELLEILEPANDNQS